MIEVFFRKSIEDAVSAESCESLPFVVRQASLHRREPPIAKIFVKVVKDSSNARNNAIVYAKFF
jgi:hypothetical protein